MTSLTQRENERIEVGAKGWRGYARTYPSSPTTWFPEIRPCTIRRIKSDGYLEVANEGLMPGSEGKRNPGCWISLAMDPDDFCATPEAALERAKRAAAQHGEPHP